MNIEVMRQALETLEEINKLSTGESAICLPAEIDSAMDALRQAIEQAEQAQPVAEAMKTVTKAMQDDPDYAWGWHCNIAMAFVDAGGDHYTANQGAAKFMRLLANVEPAHELPSTPPQRQPLTMEHAKFVIAMHTTLVNAHYDEQRNTNIIYEKTDSLGLVRAIEAAHGIGDKA
jgi:hypothetical protein